MANPDPKALQAAAATMRTQAEEARKAFVPAEGQRDKDVLAAQEDAYVQKHAAEQAVKDQQTIVDHYTRLKAEVQKQLDDDKPKIAEAEKKGDSAALEELHEHQARLQTQIAGYQERQDTAQEALDQGNVTVAEKTRDMEQVNRRYGSTLETDNTAEKQIDALEDKAKLLNEAGLKLQLASTIDNPVERADMELDAEKLLKQANAIQVDTAQITAITGQELQLPDVSALPPAADVADASSGVDDATTGATTGATGGDLQDPFAAGTGDGDSNDTTAVAHTHTTGAAATVGAPTHDVLGAAGSDLDAGSAVATATAPDPVAAIDPSAAPAFDGGSLDAGADPASSMVDPGAALADAGDDFASPAFDDAAPVDDGGDADV
jgi:hypothetical protein